MSEMYPPNGPDGPQGVPPVSGPPRGEEHTAPVTVPPPVPGTSPKQKLNWGFFLLGFFTPFLVSAVFAGASAGIASLSDYSSWLMQAVSIGGSVINLAVLVGLLIAFVKGRGNGDNRLRSLGLGGLTSYVVTMLTALLVFGSCLLILGGMGN